MIRFLINIYICILVVDVILSFLPELRKYQAAQLIRKLSEPSCRLVRRYLPSDMGFDISHFIVIVILKLITYLW